MDTTKNPYRQLKWTYLWRDQNKQKTRKIKQEKLHYTLKTFLKVHKPKTTLKRYVILFTGSPIDILCSMIIFLTFVSYYSECNVFTPWAYHIQLIMYYWLYVPLKLIELMISTPWLLIKVDIYSLALL